MDVVFVPGLLRYVTPLREGVVNSECSVTFIDSIVFIACSVECEVVLSYGKVGEVGASVAEEITVLIERDL